MGILNVLLYQKVSVFTEERIADILCIHFIQIRKGETRRKWLYFSNCYTSWNLALETCLHLKF